MIVRKSQKGIIDPISLIGVAFLLITLITAVSVTNNPLKTFILDSFAKGSCDDYGSPAKRNACKENLAAQDPTSEVYADQQAYRNAHPDEYPVIDSSGNRLSNEQQIKILSDFAATASPNETQISDFISLCTSSGGSDCQNRNTAISFLDKFYADKTQIQTIETVYQENLAALNAQLAEQAKIEAEKQAAAAKAAEEAAIAQAEQAKIEAEKQAAAAISSEAALELERESLKANVKNPVVDYNSYTGAIVPDERTRISEASRNQITTTGYTTGESKTTTIDQGYLYNLFHGDPNINITGLGTTGLANGNTLPALPQSAVTSNQGYKDYAAGTIISGAAGVSTVELAAAPFNILGIAGGSISNIPLATAMYVGNNLAAFAPTVSTLLVSGLTAGGLDCAFGFADGNLCQAAGDMAFQGFSLDPVSFTQMFNQSVRTVSDTASVLSNIRRIPTAQEAATVLNEIDDASVINLSFVDDAGQEIIMPANSAARAISGIEPPINIPNPIADVSITGANNASGLNTIGNTAGATQATGPNLSLAAVITRLNNFFQTPVTPPSMPVEVDLENAMETSNNTDLGNSVPNRQQASISNWVNTQVQSVIDRFFDITPDLNSTSAIDTSNDALPLSPIEPENFGPTVFDANGLNMPIATNISPVPVIKNVARNAADLIYKLEPPIIRKWMADRSSMPLEEQYRRYVIQKNLGFNLDKIDVPYNNGLYIDWGLTENNMNQIVDDLYARSTAQRILDEVNVILTGTDYSVPVLPDNPGVNLQPTGNTDSTPVVEPDVTGNNTGTDSNSTNRSNRTRNTRQPNVIIRNIVIGVDIGLLGALVEVSDYALKLNGQAGVYERIDNWFNNFIGLFNQPSTQNSSSSNIPATATILPPNTVIPPTSTVVPEVINEELNKIDIYRQRDDPNLVINPWGTTMLKSGCGPSSAINALRLLGYDLTDQQIQDVIKNFYWDPITHQTGAEAVLASLKIKGSYDYGLKNQITDATLLNQYTGLLVFGGAAKSSTETVAHIAILTCNQGNCYSIDSYFGDGTPTKCNVLNSNSIQCGDYNYHVGKTIGVPDALFPILDSSVNGILPSISTSTSSTSGVENITNTPLAPQVISTNDTIIKAPEALFNDKAAYTAYKTDSNITYHVITVEPGHARFFVNLPTVKATTSNFLNYSNLDIAINGDGWELYKDEQGITRLRNGGFVMSNGYEYSDHGDEQTIYFDRNNNVSFTRPSNQNDIYNAISYPNRLIDNGVIVPHPDKTDVNPRTAFGVTAEGKILLVAVDGKEYQSGMTVPALTQLLLEQGAVNAVMFDSGSSTTMAMRDANGNPITVNNPDTTNASGENQVYTHLGIQIIP